MSAPTLINLPPPPSDPATPSEMPGTPNSTTTSMSELSTVAIKDGHRGHPHHHHLHDKSGPHSTLDAERADRISRLAGLERVTTARPASQTSLQPGGLAAQPEATGYFAYTPHTAQPREKERSTVGSASATGSVGGRTTWASGSDHYDAADKMSEDMETSSAGGFSDENASLVGFGEAASSTVSGPVSSAPSGRPTPQRHSISGKIIPAVSTSAPQYPQQASSQVYRDPRVNDGMTYSGDVADSSNATPPAVYSSNERVMADNFDDYDDDEDNDEDMGMSEETNDRAPATRRR